MLESKKILGPVAAYIRVSTDEQAERDTPELQRQEVVRWAAYQGIELAGPYYDDITGKIPLASRPGGAQLVADAKKGLFTHIVVYKLDRLARRLKVLLDEKDHLTELGIGIVSIKEGLSTDDYLGRLMFNILGTISEWEVETLALRVDAGRRVKIQDGKWIGGWLPHGLKMDSEQRLVLAPDEASVVEEAYRRYGEGETQLVILKDFNARGEAWWHVSKVQNRGDAEPTIKSVRPWNPQAMSKMLSNPIYKGEYAWGGIESEKDIPVIVSPQLWNRVSSRLDKLRNIMGSNDTPCLASGVLTCASCGEKYYHWRRKSSYRGREYYYETYICNGRRFAKCHSAILRVDTVDKLIWDYAEAWLRNPPFEEWFEEATRELGDVIGDLNDELTSYLKQLEELSDGKQEILRLARKKAISQSDLEKQLLEISVEEHLIQQEIGRVQREIRGKEDNAERRDALVKLSRQMHKKLDAGYTFEEKKQFVRNALKGGLVTTIDRGQAKKKNSHIELVWEFSESTLVPSLLSDDDGVGTIDSMLVKRLLLNGTKRRHHYHVTITSDQPLVPGNVRR